MNGAWQHRASAGGAPSRVAPDEHDVLVFYDGDCTLSLTPSTNNGYLPGPFGDAGLGYSIPNTRGGGYWTTAGTTVGESATQSISTWVYVCCGTTNGYAMPGVVKQRSTVVFADGGGPFCQGLAFLATGSGLAPFVLYQTTDDALLLSGPELDVGWHWIMQTYGGGTLRLYVDDQAVQTVTTTGGGVPDFAAHGPWVLGGWNPNGYGNPPDSAPVGLADVRVANIVRDNAYRNRVWATRRTK